MSGAGRRLRIMLVDSCPERFPLLEGALVEAGHEVVARVTTGEDLTERMTSLRPDVIVIDIDSPDRDILEHMRIIHRDRPCPIVMFTNDDNGDTIRAAVRAGVHAYVVDGLSTSRVLPILEVAIARFEEYQEMRQELERTRTALDERKIIERAKGILMRQAKLDEEAAYKAMRKMAMDRNLKMVDLAKSVIAAAELLGGAEGMKQR
jgi:response regulator NasT